jgi:cytidylate kinase
MVVAIDGPAASGKTTTAKLAAERLGFFHLDTGAMYRAVTWKALAAGVDLHDWDALGRLAAATRLEVREIEGGARYRIDGEDVTDRLRDPSVSRAVSFVARVPAVRRVLVGIQREIAGQRSVVVEGRDIGTVVFPDARVKVFLIASLAERARRRREELAAKGIVQGIEETAAEIRARDEIDSERADSPLVPAPDAVELDTTGLAIPEQVEAVIKLVRRAQAAGWGGMKDRGGLC